MRPSRLLKKARAGGIPYMFKHNFTDPRAADIAAASGFDCLWLCMEHTANDWSDIERQIYAAKAWNVDVMVRVPRGSYSDLIRPLELDASGVMVPHCMSLADAKEIVRRLRFHPLGRRPVDGGNADGAYCRIPFTDYLAQANRERFIGIQIEDPEPLDDLDAICAVEGIDMIFFGPGDFSHAIGAPGRMDHPLVVETRRRVAECARKHGKIAAMPASLDNIESLKTLGYNCFNVGADVLCLTDYCTRIATGLGLKPNRPAGA